MEFNFAPPNLSIKSDDTSGFLHLTVWMLSVYAKCMCLQTIGDSSTEHKKDGFSHSKVLLEAKQIKRPLQNPVVMPSKCYSCGKTSRGNLPTATIDGEERGYCADCFWKLEKEYQNKKSCEDCAYFSGDHCKKTDVYLTPMAIGFGSYFVQAENCNYFCEDKEAFLSEAKKLEAKGRYEEAACLYDRLDMPDKAEAARAKVTAAAADIKALAKRLAENNQVLTYYCPHCGSPLKVGAKATQIQKDCPKCGGDLEVLDLAKLIEQHSQN